MTDPVVKIDDALPAELRALWLEDGNARVDVLHVVEVLQRHARGRDVDLVVAGVLARRAWTSLREESADVLERALTPTQAAPAIDQDARWRRVHALVRARVDAPGARIEDADVADVATLLPSRLRSPPARSVTLAELVEIFADAQREIEARAATRAARTRRARPRAGAPSAIVDEDLQEDLARLVRELADRGGSAWLDEISPATRACRVADLQAALHLASSGAARLAQDTFPTGRIRVELTG